MKRNLLVVILMLVAAVAGGAPSPRRMPACMPVMTCADPGIFKCIWYDEAGRLLILRFPDGAAYEYRGIPPLHAYRLLNSPSKGYYFNREIRGRFAFRRLIEVP